VLNDGDHLGPVLVQLPPNFKFDQPLLEDFLALRPPAFLFAFEVRHPSWYTEGNLCGPSPAWNGALFGRDREGNAVGSPHSRFYLCAPAT